MNIIVCVKQTVDLQQVRVRKETREPVFDNVPLTISNIDKNALEEAVGSGKRWAARLLLFPQVLNSWRILLRKPWPWELTKQFWWSHRIRGADSGVAAAALAKAVGRVEDYSLILLGEGSADNYSGQVGPAWQKSWVCPR